MFVSHDLNCLSESATVPLLVGLSVGAVEDAGHGGNLRELQSPKKCSRPSCHPPPQILRVCWILSFSLAWNRQAT